MAAATVSTITLSTFASHYDSAAANRRPQQQAHPPYAVRRRVRATRGPNQPPRAPRAPTQNAAWPSISSIARQPPRTIAPNPHRYRMIPLARPRPRLRRRGAPAHSALPHTARTRAREDEPSLPSVCVSNVWFTSLIFENGVQSTLGKSRPNSPIRVCPTSPLTCPNP